MRISKLWMRALFLMGLFCLLFALPVLAAGADSLPLIGKWAFTYAPEEQVLAVSEDGTAEYNGKAYTWEASGTFLLLKDEEGDILPLRYLIMEDRRIIYPQTVYHRGKEVDGQGGLIGIWEGTDTGSSFVFTPAGYFLEDNSFSGNFMIDPEEGTFLLHYGDAFADTLCYFSLSDDDLLTVEYPWELTGLK